MDRLFERAFSKAHGAVQSVVGTEDPEAKQAAQQKSREDTLRRLTTPMSAADVVERMGLAFRDGDYFRRVAQQQQA